MGEGVCCDAGIKFDDPELQLVTDADEWRHLNKAFGQGVSRCFAVTFCCLWFR